MNARQIVMGMESVFQEHVTVSLVTLDQTAPEHLAQCYAVAMDSM